MTPDTITRAQSVAFGAIGLLAFLGIWSFLSLSGVVLLQFLPAPHEVAARFIDLLTSQFAGATLQQHLASSALRFAYGFVLGAVIGIPLGLLMGWFRVLDEIVSPVFDALRFVAPIAWVPFAALWFGTGLGGPILIIFAGACPPGVRDAYGGGLGVSSPPGRADARDRHQASSPRCCCRPPPPRSSPACGCRPGSAGSR